MALQASNVVNHWFIDKWKFPNVVMNKLNTNQELSRDKCRDENLNRFFENKRKKGFDNISQEFKEFVGTCRRSNKHRSNSTKNVVFILRANVNYFSEPLSYL